MNPTSTQLSILERIAHSSPVKLRYEGMQYRKDVTMRKSDIAAIKETLAFYDDLKSGKY